MASAANLCSNAVYVHKRAFPVPNIGPVSHMGCLGSSFVWFKFWGFVILEKTDMVIIYFVFNIYRDMKTLIKDVTIDCES